MSERALNYRQVRVSFRKQVSDGNYGTEAAEVTLEEWLEPDAEPELDEATARVLLESARAECHAELMRSPSARIRELFVPRAPSRMSVPDEPEDSGDEVPF